MVAAAVRAGCGRRPHHHLVLRAQGRVQGTERSRSSSIEVLPPCLSVLPNLISRPLGVTSRNKEEIILQHL